MGLLLAGPLLTGPAAAQPPPPLQPAPPHGARGDFDFEFGAWHTHVRLLAHPPVISRSLCYR
jgi:hypothetical protein